MLHFQVDETQEFRLQFAASEEMIMRTFNSLR